MELLLDRPVPRRRPLVPEPVQVPLPEQQRLGGRIPDGRIRIEPCVDPGPVAGLVLPVITFQTAEPSAGDAPGRAEGADEDDTIPGADTATP
ncbi:hypothetical protein [Streptomyces geranii]|uniref:hypothetical protein n=1 Tax=Streptomyces geranii TaxID=2058923 RepID=UPI000D02390C|nr:hypothetical protein [Streptomyces geranii]